jgi:hypothetical protein
VGEGTGVRDRTGTETACSKRNLQSTVSSANG